MDFDIRLILTCVVVIAASRTIYHIKSNRLKTIFNTIAEYLAANNILSAREYFEDNKKYIPFNSVIMQELIFAFSDDDINNYRDMFNKAKLTYDWYLYYIMLGTIMEYTHGNTDYAETLYHSWYKDAVWHSSAENHMEYARYEILLRLAEYIRDCLNGQFENAEYYYVQYFKERKSNPSWAIATYYYCTVLFRQNRVAELKQLISEAEVRLRDDPYLKYFRCWGVL